MRFWLPDYFCGSSLGLLRATGAEILFYPVLQNLQPDYAVCRLMAEDRVPDVFVLAHFFGEAIPTAPAREFCTRHGTWLVEDAAHVPVPCSGVGETGDFVFYSPHKSHALPDGALLIVRKQGPSRLGDAFLERIGCGDQWWHGLAQAFGPQAPMLLPSWKTSLTWLLKRLIQKMGVTRRAQAGRFQDRPAESPACPSHVGPRLSWLAEKLLSAGVDLEQAGRIRRRNQAVWDGLLAGRADLSPSNRVVGQVPYLARYLIGGTSGGGLEDREALFRRYLSMGLPLLTWPDLPREVHADPQTHGVSWDLRHDSVFLPVHQSLTVRDIMAATRSDGLRKRGMAASDCSRIEWDVLDQFSWHSYLKQTGRSSLLQSWAWGEAKSRVEGWNVRRALIFVDGKPLALAQVLIRRLGGILNVVRINRGPIFLRATDSSERALVVEALRRELAGLSRGRVLSLLPELPWSAEAFVQMESMGVRLVKRRPWASAWVDLGLPVEVLRRQLHSKWRNMLSFAERQGLKLEVRHDPDAFAWLVERCAAQMRERNGPVVPEELYRVLHTELAASGQPMMVFRALADGEVVAGVAVAPHGAAVTYLLGWNGEPGRRLKANQFLLWNSMLHCRGKGFLHFDMGGIDETGTPGIADFKLGVAGERYSLVGEGWCW